MNQSYAASINDANYVPKNVKCFVIRGLATGNTDLNEATTILLEQHLIGIDGLSSDIHLGYNEDKVEYVSGNLTVSAIEKPRKAIQHIVEAWMKAYVEAGEADRVSAMPNLLFVELDENDVDVVDAWIVEDVRPGKFTTRAATLPGGSTDFPNESPRVEITLLCNIRTGLDLVDGEVEAFSDRWTTPSSEPAPVDTPPSTSL